MKEVDEPTRVRLTALLPSDISLLQHTRTLWKLLRSDRVFAHISSFRKKNAVITLWYQFFMFG